MDRLVFLSSEPLDGALLLASVRVPEHGGVVLFSGDVRSVTRGVSTSHLIYEAYEDMALSEMKKIACSAMERWEARVAIAHRLGRLEIGDVAVVTVASCAHRDAAFECCRFLIDSVKANVPIWKKEFGPDGEHWVEGQI